MDHQPGSERPHASAPATGAPPPQAEPWAAARESSVAGAHSGGSDGAVPDGSAGGPRRASTAAAAGSELATAGSAELATAGYSRSTAGSCAASPCRSTFGADSRSASRRSPAGRIVDSVRHPDACASPVGAGDGGTATAASASGPHGSPAASSEPAGGSPQRAVSADARRATSPLARERIASYPPLRVVIVTAAN